jgi:hypothetical protein
MSEQFEHNPGDHDDPVGDTTWVVGIGGAVILTVLVIAIAVLYYHTDQEVLVERVINEMPDELVRYRNDQESKLADWGPIPVLDETGKPAIGANGQPRQRVHMPISRAMDIIVAEGTIASSPNSATRGGIQGAP